MTPNIAKVNYSLIFILTKDSNLLLAALFRLSYRPIRTRVASNHRLSVCNHTLLNVISLAKSGTP